MLHDKEIREPLFEFLEEWLGKLRIIEEKQMGKSRADIVMVLPEAVAGIEIKSDADTYARLAGQVRDYDQYFDQNYVAVGSRHGLHIEEHVPDWWGIITIEETDSGVDFYVLRKAEKNPLMDWKKKMSLLWRPELVHIQEKNELPKYKEKSKQFVIERIVQKVPEETLAVQVSEELFERDYNQIAETMQEYREKNGSGPRKRGRRRSRG